MIFMLPETEHRTLEDIEIHFSDNKRSIFDRHIKIGAQNGIEMKKRMLWNAIFIAGMHNLYNIHRFTDWFENWLNIHKKFCRIKKRFQNLGTFVFLTNFELEKIQFVSCFSFEFALWHQIAAWIDWKSLKSRYATFVSLIFRYSQILAYYY